MAKLLIGRFPVAKVPIAKLNFGLFKAQSVKDRAILLSKNYKPTLSDYRKISTAEVKINKISAFLLCTLQNLSESDFSWETVEKLAQSLPKTLTVAPDMEI